MDAHQAYKRNSPHSGTATKHPPSSTRHRSPGFLWPREGSRRSAPPQTPHSHARRGHANPECDGIFRNESSEPHGHCCSPITPPRPQRPPLQPHVGMRLGHGQMVVYLGRIRNRVEVLAHTLQCTSHKIGRALLSKPKHHTAGNAWEGAESKAVGALELPSCPEGEQPCA